MSLRFSICLSIWHWSCSWSRAHLWRLTWLGSGSFKDEKQPLNGHGRPQSPTWGTKVGVARCQLDMLEPMCKDSMQRFYSKINHPPCDLAQPKFKIWNFEIMISHKRSLIVCRGHVEHHSFRSCFLCQLVPAVAVWHWPICDLLHKLTCRTVDIEAIIPSKMQGRWHVAAECP